jgi:hypothetical protein
LPTGEAGGVALWIGYLAQAITIGGSAAAMLLTALPEAVYAGAIVAASAVTLTRPAQLALLPALVETTAELTAANAVSGWVESVSMLAGPAAAGVMMALGGPGAALALYAGVTSIGAQLVTPLATSRAGAGSRPRCRCRRVPWSGIRRRRHTRCGAGAGAPVGRRRLSGALVGAALAWGAAFVAVGVWPAAGAAFVLLGACGVSRAVVDVAARTMLHCVVPPQLHGRVFGVLEGLTMLGLAAGSLSVPALVAVGGAGAAWIGIGLLLMLVALAAMRPLRAVDGGAPTFIAGRLEASGASRVG